MNNEAERLNKYLALQLGISRREADEIIAASKVTINGKVVGLGSRVAANDVVAVSGKVLKSDQAFRYVLFNKPVGYVCSRRPQGDNPTIYSVLPDDMRVLKPVGRLDKDSSGLLLLTNDGGFAHRMTHPSFQKIKVYEVSLNTPLEPLHQQMIADYGIEIGDGVSQLSLERITDSRLNWMVTMREGRNRQIRRTFAALGYDVVRLNRTQFSYYTLESLYGNLYQTIELS